MAPTDIVNRAMTASEWLMLMLLSVLWGGSFFFVAILVKSLPPLTIVFLRVGLASVMLHALVRALGKTMPAAPGAWRAFFAMGLLNNAIPFCLIAWAQGHIPSGLAAILNATTPISTVLVAHVLTDDEKLTVNRLAGVVAGFLGVVILVGPNTMTGLVTGPGTNLLAQFAVLAAASSYAFAGVYGRRFRTMGIDPLLTATGQVTASALMLCPLVLLLDQPWTLAMPPLPVWAAALGIALFSTALGYVLYFRILATAGATNLLLVTLLIPVSAIIMGTLVLGEGLELRQIAGFACIGVGLAAIDGRLLMLFRRVRPPVVDPADIA
jgi:drug/metabolite transporter (DMT)-like permease